MFSGGMSAKERNMSNSSDKNFLYDDAYDNNNGGRSAQPLIQRNSTNSSSLMYSQRTENTPQTKADFTNTIEIKNRSMLSWDKINYWVPHKSELEEQVKQQRRIDGLPDEQTMMVG